MSIGELRVLVAKQLDLAWKELCEADTMRASFPDMRLSLKLDGSQLRSSHEIPRTESWEAIWHNNAKYTSRFDCRNMVAALAKCRIS